MRRKIVLGTYVALCFFLISATREVTVYRLQLAAYKDRAAAEEKVASLLEVAAGTPMIVERANDKTPFKVQVGQFGTYKAAKAAEKIYDASGLNAFVVSELVPSTVAQEKGIAIPKSLYDIAKQTPANAVGMPETELYYNAKALADHAQQAKTNQEKSAILEPGVPYLREIAETHAKGQHAAWARHQLGTHYLRTYYAQHEKWRAGSADVSSVTNEAAIESAIEQFEKLVESYPKCSYAEKDAYQVASLKATRRWGGVQIDNMKRGIGAYEEFLAKYPAGRLAGRARMNIAAIQFEMAKSKRFPMEQAYAAMANLVSATDVPLGDFERGRTLLMMGEIQMRLKDPQAALDVLLKVDLGPKQDRTTAASVEYLLGEAYFGVKNYEKAIETFQHVYSTYEEADFWLKYRDQYHPFCLYNIGKCQMSLGDTDAAYVSFRAVRVRWPKNALAVDAESILQRMDQERKAQ